MTEDSSVWSRVSCGPNCDSNCNGGDDEEEDDLWVSHPQFAEVEEKIHPAIVESGERSARTSTSTWTTNTGLQTFSTVTPSMNLSASVNPYSEFGFMTLTVPALRYSACSSDPIDVEMVRQLRSLDKDSVDVMTLRRLAAGKYEILGRQVSVFWDSAPSSPRLWASETVGTRVTAAEADVPLDMYLKQVANLARMIRPEAAPRCLTFPDEASLGTTANMDGADRFECMRVACEQARLREQAADAYWKGPAVQ